jgi:hypothetical protein
MLFCRKRSKNVPADWSKDLREPGANPADSPISRSAGCQPAFLTLYGLRRYEAFQAFFQVKNP